MWAVLIAVAFSLSRFTELYAVYMYVIVLSLDILKCVVGYIFVKKGIWFNNLVEDSGDSKGVAKAEA